MREETRRLQERDEVHSWDPRLLGEEFRDRDFSFVPEEFSPGAKKWIPTECNEVESGASGPAEPPLSGS